ncbi:P2X purinoceptor 3a isoform X1 [Nothobranchius furzeri]|uniref:P2X purinoceptor 3a isoform X1 n=1 Tax=Nothobranchius furzeri TaxID=105023 RepID=UPI00240473B9|nr:P2X purinoceptor 3a isoform X1 [Nothobranchius furzeri]
MMGVIAGFFSYETNKSVVVKSWSVGIINRVVQLVIITYFVCYVFLYEKAYQVSDTAIESSVITKVKGFGELNNRVMDVADYIYPPQGAGVFCILTRIIVTDNQFQGRCPEVGKSFLCETDETCTAHIGSVVANGKITGNCSRSSNETEGHCEIEGWCPAENDEVTKESMLEFKDFTIFIKNSIRFPLFDVTRGNFPSTLNITNCTFDKDLDPSCPIFRVQDILRETQQNASVLAKKGGEIGINIEWQCNLDLNIDRCVPKYSFRRLDAPFENNTISKGYNFRFAKYYKTEKGTEFRTLHKAYAVRFDVMVTGKARKFSLIPTVINVVAALTSIGMGTVVCDVILLNFLRGAEQYKAKKFEEVSEDQIRDSITPSPGSQLSLKPGIKSCYDSGAISLSTSD